MIAGLEADNLLFEHPHEQKREPAAMRLDTIPGMKAVYVRWLVEGAGPYTVTIQSTKGGTAQRTSNAK